MIPTFRKVFLTLLLTLAVVQPFSSASAQQSAPSRRDLAKEERNRKVVIDFYEGVFIRHDVAKSSEVLSDNYIQHNPGVPDGKAPFVDYFTALFKSNPDARSRIVRSATDGDLVYLHVHSTSGKDDRGQAIVDIFRVADDRIVEHWDVIQAIPEKSANKNSMF